MASERGKQVSTLIFLFAVFIFLAFFTGGWLYRVYIEKTTFSEQLTDIAIKCSSIYFGVRDIDYREGVLSFELHNKLGDAFEDIVIESGETLVEVPTGRLGAGDELPVQQEIGLEGSVRIYPKGCREENSKIFELK